MPDDKLKLVEAGAMLILLKVMQETAVVANADLKKIHGFELTKDARDRLRKLGLIDVREEKRRLYLTVTDKGWSGRWLEFDIEMPVRNLYQNAVIKSQIDVLRRHHAHSRLALSDLYPPLGDEDVQSSPPPPGDLTALVRKAYDNLAAAPGAEVMLRSIRAALPEISRAELDETLIAMNREPGIRVYAEANQKTLTAADRAAAVTIGNQDKHVLTIG
ncbi:hypothetical protein [Actinoplanes sp. N902-109]|uniref:hypothetical protein n=1 Tax=Actinoplanes sp. (strain N902-109) TaxID=649831 RepID=UPI0003A9524D|nr:hypothetical protein [Actinoplanes sp. N902-109]